MASNSVGRGNEDDDSPTSQPIPLQDLSRPPDTSAAFEGHGRSWSRSFPHTGNYTRIADDSSTDIPGAVRDSPASPYTSDDNNNDNNAPVVDDLGAFAQATSGLDLPGVGLQVHGPSQTTGSPSGGLRDSSDTEYHNVPLTNVDSYGLDSYSISPAITNEEDTARLTDRTHLQPISGASTAPDQSSSRPSGSLLGDDLPRLETDLESQNSRANNVTGSWPPSPSTSSSALHRASSMMKSMSKRVVNLSNEPEVVEESIQNKENWRNSRLEGPPSLPAMKDYAHDRSQSGHHFTGRKRPRSTRSWRYGNNPLKDKSLYLFAPDNPVRTSLCDVLVHPFMEPTILLIIVVQTILLAVESASSDYANGKSRFSRSSMDYAFLAIFIIYTLEIIARIVVSGFIFNPHEYSTLDRSLPWGQAVLKRGNDIIQPQRQLSKKVQTPVESQISIIRTVTGLNQNENQEINDDRQKKRIRLAHRAFLRHSFNRLDFVAVVSFWIYLCLTLTYSDAGRIFRMLSCLRILRLLSVTNGTSVILQSLKKAAPLLAHVAFLVGFFWLIFAIIGNQSFKSSLRRTCVWIDPSGRENYTMNNMYETPQFCGGHYTADWQKSPWIKYDETGHNSNVEPKGYLCPPGSMCIEGKDNPFNNTMSFDDILHSIELVFVIMSSNTFSDIMYYTTDSDFLPAALFFASGILILSLWLVNLLVAVITHSFQVIREESKRSAFAAQKIDEVDTDSDSSRKVSRLKLIYDKTAWLWICIIIFDLVVMALRSSDMGEERERFITDTEIVVSLILLVEIILRFASDWRRFHRRWSNLFDLGLAIITCIIQIPAIRHEARAYSILSIFQILRIYRVVLAFPMTRDLIMVVLRNTGGLLNLIIFVFLITFLAAIFATQLFRGRIPKEDPTGQAITITFSDIYNSFLGMYQVLSTEDWTTILYNATAYTQGHGTAWVSAAFFILWFIVANFIVLNMFIAVIHESFDVSEDEKRLYQVKAFLEQKNVGGPAQGNLSLSTILKLGRDSGRFRDPLDHGPAALVMLLKDAVVREFLDDPNVSLANRRQESMPIEGMVEEAGQPSLVTRAWDGLKSFFTRRGENPFFTKPKVSPDYEALDPKTMAREVVTAEKQRRQAQREFLMKHPNFNKSLFIFAPGNPIRHFCQRIVGAGRGDQRVEGVEPYKTVWYTFSAFIYAAIVAMVLLACITTPIYQRENFQDKSTKNWFVYTDLGFSILFTVEALIKVIADGFFWTPNAWLRSSWGFIDGFVLVTLWINVVTSLLEDWTVSRFVGAFKALRALRLLNVSDSARNTFHSVIILGGWNVISAAAVSLSFLIPVAIYSVNLFNGQLVSCNDDNVKNGDLNYCFGEYTDSPYNWDVLMPRVASNPYYNFDNFGQSLFILFQIVSQEGWVDVQESVMKITGKGNQPDDLATTSNGFFFVIFNLLGAVFVLTLFVSVFMRNYTEQTGVAFLTAEQRSWLELRKHLRQVSPSKKSVNSSSPEWRKWCYRIASKKYGRWAKFVTYMLVLHLILLVLEFYPENMMWEIVRQSLFFALTVVFLGNVIIRVAGLGWHRFRRSSWDIYALLVVPGSLTTNILNIVWRSHQSITIVHKLFLVSITLLLIPRNNQLDQLFKTAAASFTGIGNLIATWFVLFLAFAIAMNQIFGLTKFGSQGTNNLNFRDVPNALILLFRMSCGEGWNEIMEDFANMVPPYCTYNDDHFTDDCGSTSWARCLFIAWNIISMYIFVSLFVSLIYESFSYVYQQSSGLYAINRDEIRRYKRAWAMFDPDGTGFITKEQFPRLLGELTGAFDVRIYSNEFTVKQIKEQCLVNPGKATPPRGRVVEGMDLEILSRIVQRIPVEEIRARRERLNQFYEEVLVSADLVRGISFHTCLMILAHHNVINDSKSLRLEEFLRRRARLQRVDEAVRRSIVIGFFDTLYWSRRFRQRINERRSARMDAVPQFSVPEIFVDYQEEENDNETSSDDREDINKDEGQPVMGSGDIASANENDGESSPMLSPTTTRSRAHTSPSIRRNPPPLINTSATATRSGASSPTEWANISPSLSPRRHNVEPLYDDPDDTEEGDDQIRQNNTMSVQDVMDSFGNSVWGESLRRSFTQRRPGDRRTGE